MPGRIKNPAPMPPDPPLVTLTFEAKMCGDCRFMISDGRCRRYPPQQIVVKGHDYLGQLVDNHVTDWPHVGYSHFACGEWQRVR